MRMQIHLENDANSNAKLRKAKTQADRVTVSELQPAIRSYLPLGATSWRPFLSACVFALRSSALLFASFSRWICIRISLTFFPIYLWIFDFVNIDFVKVARALLLHLPSLIRFFVRARVKVLYWKQLATSCLLRWGPLNPPTHWALGATSLWMTNPIFPAKIHGNSSIIQMMRTTSWMTTNPPKRK